jgi:hypothetical protein
MALAHGYFGEAMNAQENAVPASLRLLIAGLFCVVLLFLNNGLVGGVASGWAARKSLLLGACAAVHIAVLYPLVARGDKIQKILAAILLVVPLLGLFYAVILAANLF